jgi:membrane associated rhomboid family serine protease
MFPIKDDIPSKKFPLAIIFLIAINAAVFAYQLTLTPEQLAIFIFRYGFIPANLDFYAPQTLIPLVTSIFMHGGWLHIISNMWFLGIFGDNVEDKFGHLKFVFIYLAFGIGASLAHYFINPASAIPAIGASGAVAGVLGSYLIFFPRAKILTIVVIIFFITAVQVSATVWLGLWFGLQILGALQLVHLGTMVAYWVHIAGFLIGFITAIIGKITSPKL